MVKGKYSICKNLGGSLLKELAPQDYEIMRKNKEVKAERLPNCMQRPLTMSNAVLGAAVIAAASMVLLSPD